MGPKTLAVVDWLALYRGSFFVIKVQSETSQWWPLETGGRYSEVVVSSGLAALTLVLEINTNAVECIMMMWEFALKV